MSKSGKCDTSRLPNTPRASPVTSANPKEHHIQPKVNKQSHSMKQILIGQCKEYVGNIEAKAELGVVKATSSWNQRHSCAFLWAPLRLLVFWGW
jgi:hypothetical protein